MAREAGTLNKRQKSETAEKKELTMRPARTISRLRRRRRAHCLLRGEALVADIRQGAGQEPGELGDGSVSLFLIVG